MHINVFFMINGISLLIIYIDEYSCQLYEKLTPSFIILNLYVESRHVIINR